VPICYELLFPDLVRRFAADGAGVLLAVTNDAWYGRTGAPHQFLAMTAMRSAETGRHTVRAANTGISASIDTLGQVQDRGPDNREKDWNVDGVMRTRVWLPGGPPTFYARYGDIVGWGRVLMSVIVGIVALRPRQIEPSLQTDQERTDAANHEDQ